MLRGMAASDAISLLREKRHRLVICNPHFERWLLDSPAVAHWLASPIDAPAR